MIGADMQCTTGHHQCPDKWDFSLQTSLLTGIVQTEYGTEISSSEIKKYTLLTLFLVLVQIYTQAQYTKPEGSRLRAIVEEKYNDGNLYIGSACHAHLLSTSTATVLAEEFSYITPANKFKQSYIHPEPGKWQWEDSDNWVKFATEKILRLYNLIETLKNEKLLFLNLHLNLFIFQRLQTNP